jgi:hypothetical protein
MHCMDVAAMAAAAAIPRAVEQEESEALFIVL